MEKEICERVCNMAMIPEIFYFIYLEEHAVSKREICFEVVGWFLTWTGAMRLHAGLSDCPAKQTAVVGHYGSKDCHEIFTPSYLQLTSMLVGFKHRKDKFEYLCSRRIYFILRCRAKSAMTVNHNSRRRRRRMCWWCLVFFSWFNGFWKNVGYLATIIFSLTPR